MNFGQMETLQIIFRIGVILGVFGFLWTLIHMALLLLWPTFRALPQSKTMLQAIQYIFIVQTTLLFCYDESSRLSLGNGSILITALLLLFYFISKMQRKQQKQILFQFIRNGQPTADTSPFSAIAEWSLIGLGALFFVLCMYNNSLIYNPITLWFRDTIVGLEKAPIFGFIFQIVGLFFVISIFTKSIQSVLNLIGIKNQDPSRNKKNDKDNFDDFEEIK